MGEKRIVLDDEVEIDRSMADVFAVLIDVERDPEWQKGLAAARYTSDGPIGVGTTGQHRAKPFGLTIEVDWQLIEFEPDRRVAWTFIGGPFDGQESYVLEPSAAGTRLAHRADLEPRGLLRLLGPLIAPIWAKQSDDALQELKKLLESAPVAR